MKPLSETARVMEKGLSTSTLCPICQSDSKVVMPLPEWGEMRECTDCGLFFANPMALPVTAEELFTKAYNGKGEAADFSNFAKKLRYRATLLRVRRYLLPPTSLRTLNWLRYNLPNGATVMDIGCGPGYFLHTLRRHGYRAIGIEPGEKPASILKEEGFQVWNGTLDNYPADWPVPDAVTSFFMLHHLPDPASFFATLRQRFPCAVLILAESHTNTMLFATKRDLPGSLPPRYFTWWIGQSLERALTQAEFETSVLELPYSTSFFISSIVNILVGTGVNIPSFLGWLLHGNTRLVEGRKLSILDYPSSSGGVSGVSLAYHGACGLWLPLSLALEGR
jgi:SAM-dependent methyltransferase